MANSAGYRVVRRIIDRDDETLVFCHSSGGSHYVE
jgi:hypothetical protein